MRLHAFHQLHDTIGGRNVVTFARQDVFPFLEIWARQHVLYGIGIRISDFHALRENLDYAVIGRKGEIPPR